MNKVEHSTYIVIGVSQAFGEKHRETVLATIHEKVDAGVSRFSVSIANPRYGPRLNVSVDRRLIQITESTGGARMFVCFRKKSDSCWYFDHGVILTIKDGWVESWQGWDGSVLFDSSKILDRILQAGNRHEDEESY